MSLSVAKQVEKIDLSFLDESTSPLTDVVQAVPTMVEYIPCLVVIDAAANWLQRRLTDTAFCYEFDPSIYFVRPQ